MSRELRDRQESLRDSLAAAAPEVPSGTNRIFCQVFDGGSIPTLVPRVFLTHPAVADDGLDTEGELWTGAVDQAVTIAVVVLGPAVPVAGSWLIAHAVAGRWLAGYGPHSPDCEQVCVTIRDTCGFDEFICPACDNMVKYSTMKVTDSRGTFLLRSPLSAPVITLAGVIQTGYIPFNSTNLWDPDRDCATHVSGQGVYGYYLACGDTTITLVQRVFFDLCEGEFPTEDETIGSILTGGIGGLPLEPYRSGIAADATWDGTLPNAFFWLDFPCVIVPSNCNPWNHAFTFSHPAYRYSGGWGELPHGSVTLPSTAATVTALPVPSLYVKGATVTLYDQDDTVVDTCTTDIYGKCCLDPPEAGQYWVHSAKAGCGQLQVDPEINARCGAICTTCYDCPGCADCLEPATMTVTDANGTYAYGRPGAIGWINPIPVPPRPAPSNTTVHTFPSTHLWDLAYDCETFASGNGAYGYYWYCSGETVTLVQRVFMDFCPPPETFPPWSLTAADARTLTAFWADFSATITPEGCSPFSNEFTFPDEPTAYGFDVTDWHLGPPPHGTVTRPCATATLAVTIDSTPVVCCDPCPAPKADLKVTFTGGPGGTVTLVYSPPQTWTSAPVSGVTYGWDCYYGLTAKWPPTFCPDLLRDTDQMPLLRYTCDPFVLTYDATKCFITHGLGITVAEVTLA